MVLVADDLTIHPPCSHCWLMLVVYTTEALKLGMLLSLCDKNQKYFTVYPFLKWLVNGHITEAKQPGPWINTKIGDHLVSRFFSFAEMLGKLSKFVKSTRISRNLDYPTRISALPLGFSEILF